MNDLLQSSAAAIAASVREGRVRARDVAEAALARAAALEPKLHAFISIERERVLARATSIDAAPRKGRLAGVPVVVKDNICVTGETLTCGSRILQGFRAPYDATVIARLRAEGAIFLGRANMDEFAMGSSCEHSSFGPTRNPWDTARVPGGSSGGSAAAVAAGYAPLALGSDTGGSIRQPAALCGVIGIKPTYGRLSRYGLVAFGSSLDQIGPFARSVEDAALALEIMAGEDGQDATTLREPAPVLSSRLDQREPRGLRVGVVEGHLGKGCDPGVRAAVEKVLKRVESEGAILVPLKMPYADYGVQTYYIIATSEASSNLSRFDGVRYGLRRTGDGGVLDLYEHSRGEGFGPEVKRRIMLGTFALSAGYQDAYYKRALKVRELVRREYAQCFAACDVILGPASPQTAFELGAKSSDPLTMYLCDVYTIGANLAGIPAMSLPCGLDERGLPVGLQIQAPVRGELTMLQAARMVEKLVPAAPCPLGMAQSR